MIIEILTLGLSFVTAVFLASTFILQNSTFLAQMRLFQQEQERDRLRLMPVFSISVTAGISQLGETKPAGRFDLQLLLNSNDSFQTVLIPANQYMQYAYPGLSITNGKTLPFDSVSRNDSRRITIAFDPKKVLKKYKVNGMKCPAFDLAFIDVQGRSYRQRFYYWLVGEHWTCDMPLLTPDESSV